MTPDSGGAGRGRVRLAAALAGLGSGLLAFALGETILDWYPPGTVPQSRSGLEVMAPTVETIAVADARNAALAFACLGGAAGLAFGLAGGLATRSARRAIRAGLAGLVLGSALGWALPTLLVLPFLHFQQGRDSADDLLAPLALHGALWGPLGAVAGLAFGLGLGGGWRQAARMAALGTVGACLGTAAYEVAGVGLDPMALTTEPVSKTWVTRLMARLLVTLGVAALLQGASPGRGRPA